MSYEAIQDELKSLRKEVTAMKQKEAKAFLKEKGIPSVYIHEMDLEKDFNSQLDEISKSYKKDGGSFKDGKEPKEPTDEELAHIVGGGPVPETDPKVKKGKGPSKEELENIVGGPTAW